MNAKNNAKLVVGASNGGYYVPVARPSLLGPEAKVYNVFSKVSASQAPPRDTNAIAFKVRVISKVLFHHLLRDSSKKIIEE